MPAEPSEPAAPSAPAVPEPAVPTTTPVAETAATAAPAPAAEPAMPSKLAAIAALPPLLRRKRLGRLGPPAIRARPLTPFLVGRVSLQKEGTEKAWYPYSKLATRGSRRVGRSICGRLGHSPFPCHPPSGFLPKCQPRTSPRALLRGAPKSINCLLKGNPWSARSSDQSETEIDLWHGTQKPTTVIRRTSFWGTAW